MAIWKGSTATTTELGDIDTSVAGFPDAVAVFVKGKESWYYFDESSSESGDGDTIVAPSSGAGRWYKINSGDSGSSSSILTLDNGLTVYVSPSGDDTNDGMSSSSPWATIQKALDYIGDANLNFNDYTIQLMDGVHDADNYLNVPGTLNTAYSDSNSNYNNYINIVGNSSDPSAVTVNNQFYFFHSNVSFYVSDLILKNDNPDSGGYIFYMDSGQTYLEIGSNVTFSNCDVCHIFAKYGSLIRFSDNFTINGGATYFLYLKNQGTAVFDCYTVTINNTPSFTNFFYLFNQALVDIASTGTGFSGSATGTRYSLDSGSDVYVYDEAGTRLPGDAEGRAVNNSLYGNRTQQWREANNVVGVDDDNTLSGTNQFDGNVGFYSTSPVAQPTVADSSVGDISSGSDSVDLADLNTKINSIESNLNDVITALKTLGLLG
jgi:hypothetical protein